MSFSVFSMCYQGPFRLLDRSRLTEGDVTESREGSRIEMEVNRQT